MRVGAIAIGSWYAFRAAVVFIMVIREGARVDFDLALNPLMSAAFGVLIAVSGATGNVTLAWAAVAVLALQWVIRGVERLLGPPEPG